MPCDVVQYNKLTVVLNLLDKEVEGLLATGRAFSCRRPALLKGKKDSDESVVVVYDSFVQPFLLPITMRGKC